MLVNVNGETFELSDDIVEDFGNLTELRQNFVLFRLSGLTNHDAYVMAGGTATDEKSISVCASRMNTDPQVKSVIDRARALRFTRHIMTRDEMACMLSQLARTDADDVVEFIGTEDTDGNVRQTQWALRAPDDMRNAGIKAISEVTAGKDGLKVKTYSKLDAAKQLSALMGYDKPQELNVSISKGLSDLYDDFDAEDAQNG